MTQTLRIDGMTCAACTARIERVLSREAGVEGARANLVAGTVSVDGTAAPEVLAAAISRAGFQPVETVTRLAIGGMTCASCVARLERVLAAVPGVQAASVTLAGEAAQVRHLAVTGLPEVLAAAVRGAGYEARVVNDDSRAEIARHRAAEQSALARSVLVAGLLTLPVFVVEMGGHLVPAFHHWLHGLIDPFWLRLAQFVLATAVLFGPGWRFWRAGVPALLHRAPDMNSLVVLGAGAAWAWSSLSTFAPGILPEGAASVWFEAAAVIVTLILLGRWLESRARGQAGAAIARLAGMRPAVVRRADGSEVALGEVAVGDLLQLSPGERVAVDGRVVAGQSWLDESMLTGEANPVLRGPGDPLTAGTLNGAGVLTYRAEAVGADTVLARIIRMVEDAQGAKLPIQALVDQVTRVFVPAVMAVAALAFGLWLALGPGLGQALAAAVSVLIIACPCAMGLATPVSILVGTGRGAELGVLFRRGDALQALQGVQVVAFDKTGTLTEGRPELVALDARGIDADAALALAAAAEAGSEHPVAHALRRAAEARGLALEPAEGAVAEPGFGLSARVGGQAVLIGAERLMQREGVALDTLPDLAAQHAAAGRTVLYLAVDRRVAALIVVADRVRPGARAAVAALHGMGLSVAMVSGDGRATAQAIAAELGIDQVQAEVLPDGKVAAIESLRAGGRKVAFVGDGLNDAPALAAADVGIAIGTGTDVAIEAAEVVLVSGDPFGVLTALRLSRAVLANIRQNLFWAFAYNAALIPVAAGALYPLWGLTLSPMLGAGAMALSSIFVVTNALRLRRLAAAHPGG